MKPKDILNLAIRILGLAFLYRGLSAIPIAPAALFGSVGTAIMAVLTVGWPLLVAYWLLRGAPLLMRIAYPDAGPHSEASVVSIK